MSETQEQPKPSESVNKSPEKPKKNFLKRIATRSFLSAMALSSIIEGTAFIPGEIHLEMF